MIYNLSIPEILIRYVLMSIIGGIVAVTQLYWLMPVTLYLFMTAILGSDPIYHFVGKRKPLALPEEEVTPDFNLSQAV